MKYLLSKKEKEENRIVVNPISIDLSVPPIHVFMQLTRWTCPHGYEDMLYGPTLRALGWTNDFIGNFHFQVGEDSRTLFAAHLDTVGPEIPNHVVHVEKDGFIGTDGFTILGADDKAGVTILLFMAHVHKVPGSYALFVGEEPGGIGSSQYSDVLTMGVYDRMICFDRMGYDSVITEQSSGVCCSNEFAQALSNKLNACQKGLKFSPDDSGLFTDSAHFIDIIPECTNLSVGYRAAHSANEQQNIFFLNLMAEIVAEIDWEDLPTVRDPSVRDYGRGYGKYSNTTNTNYSYWQKDKNDIAAIYDIDELYHQMATGKLTWTDLNIWIKSNSILATELLWTLIRRYPESVLLMEENSEWTDYYDEYDDDETDSKRRR